MKKSLFSSTLLASLTASAGDVGIQDPFTWEGFYAGIIGGVGKIHNDRLEVSAPSTVTLVAPAVTHVAVFTTTIFTDTLSFTSTLIDPAATFFIPGLNQSIPGLNDSMDFSSNDESWYLGGQIGYNYQFGPLLFGGVVDMSGANRSDTVGAFDGIFISADLNWFATSRLLVGVPYNQFLIYGSGGLAWGNFDLNISQYNVASASSNVNEFGWAAGGGVAYAFNNNWIIDAGYIHLDFGSVAITTLANSFSADLNADLFRLGLSYKFSEWG